MALTRCSECGREVSDKAVACPGCGAPVADLSSNGRGRTIETTRSGGKYELLGFVMIVTGMLTAMASSGALGQAGGWLAGIGLCVFLFGRFF